MIGENLASIQQEGGKVVALRGHSAECATETELYILWRTQCLAEMGFFG